MQADSKNIYWSDLINCLTGQQTHSNLLLPPGFSKHHYALAGNIKNQLDNINVAAKPNDIPLFCPLHPAYLYQLKWGGISQHSLPERICQHFRVFEIPLLLPLNFLSPHWLFFHMTLINLSEDYIWVLYKEAGICVISRCNSEFYLRSTRQQQSPPTEFQPITLKLIYLKIDTKKPWTKTILLVGVASYGNVKMFRFLIFKFSYLSEPKHGMSCQRR